MEQIFVDAGLPADAYINVFATNEQVADIIADPRVAGVSVTGSERAGSAVAEVAGRHLKKVVLELGGLRPVHRAGRRRPREAVKSAVRGRMGNAGQACNGAKRMIVVDELYDDFVEQFTAAMAALTPGDPFDESTGFGPLSSEGAAHEAARAGRGRRRQGRDRAHRRQARSTVPARSSRPPCSPTSPRRCARTARSSSAPLPSSTGSRTPTRRSRWPTTRRSASAASCGAPTPRRRAGRRPARHRHGVDQQRRRARSRTCRSAAPSAPGVGRELGPYGIDEFVNKKLIYTPAAR